MATGQTGKNWFSDKFGYYFSFGGRGLKNKFRGRLSGFINSPSFALCVSEMNGASHEGIINAELIDTMQLLPDYERADVPPVTATTIQEWFSTRESAKVTVVHGGFNNEGRVAAVHCQPPVGIILEVRKKEGGSPPCFSFWNNVVFAEVEQIPVGPREKTKSAHVGDEDEGEDGPLSGVRTPIVPPRGAAGAKKVPEAVPALNVGSQERTD